MMIQISLKASVAVWIALVSATTLPGCAPTVYVTEVHTIATPRPESFDVSALAREPVGMLPAVAFDESRGLTSSVSLALMTALPQVSPPIRAMSHYETVNKLSQLGFTADQAEPTAELARGGNVNRQRLQQIGTTLGVKYVLQPGLAQFTEIVEDRLELFGFHMIKTAISRLRLWLRLWDAQAGEFLWEGAGEITVATDLLEEGAGVPLHEIARELWKRMIEQDLLGGKTGSRSFSRGIDR